MKRQKVRKIVNVLFVFTLVLQLLMPVLTVQAAETQSKTAAPKKAGATATNASPEHNIQNPNLATKSLDAAKDFAVPGPVAPSLQAEHPSIANAMEATLPRRQAGGTVAEVGLPEPMQADVRPQRTTSSTVWDSLEIFNTLSLSIHQIDKDTLEYAPVEKQANAVGKPVQAVEKNTLSRRETDASHSISPVMTRDRKSALSQPQMQTGSWGVGNIIGLNCGTEIREGSNYSYSVHTVVPFDNYEVLIKNGPRFEDGQTWWDIDRQAVSGDPNDGTGWVSQQQSDAASCPGGGGGGGGGSVVWATGATIGVCTGTEIRQGPGLAIHTIVPVDAWEIVVIEGPSLFDGQTWWNTSRFLAGDPSGGTGWISQEQAEAACAAGGASLTYLGPLPLDPAMRALFFDLGYRPYQRAILDPVNAASGVFIQEATDFDVPGVAGFDLVIKRTYNSADPRDGIFGTGWTSLLDTSLRINNDGTVDVRYGDGWGAYFVLNGDVYEPGQDGIFDELVYVNPGFELHTVDQMTYGFDQQGYLAESRDRHGNTILFDRDGDHHITQITDSGGRVFAVTYNGEHIASITDPIGRTVSYSYDGDDLMAVTDGNGGVNRYVYGDDGMTSLTDPEDINYLQNIYDDEGRVVEQIDGSGTRSYADYGDDGVTTLTDNLGNQTRYYHDDLNRVVQIEDTLGFSEYFDYDDDYNVTSYTDKRGNTWTYTYDDSSNILSETDPFGNITN